MNSENTKKAPQKDTEESKRAGLIRSFKKERNDPEMLQLAEAGLDDFLKMIEDYERNDNK